MADQQNEWTEFGDESELRPGELMGREVGDEYVVVARLPGGVQAWSGKCTHHGGPLDDGLMLGHIVTCPWHNARFDMSSGQMDAPPALNSLGCYPVKVESGKIYVGSREPHSLPEIGELEDRTFVIVGAGASAQAAAQTLRLEGFRGRIVMITPEHTPPYDRTALSKAYMAGQKEREGLGLKPDEFYEQMRISLLTGRTVARLDPQERCAVLENGDRVEFDRALVATGSRPRTAGIPGENLPGVHLLRSLADAEVISGTAEQAGTAVLLGAGFIGMELAGSLRERDLQVHVVAPEDVPLSNVFGERIGRWMQKRHQDNGTVFHMGTAAEKIERDGERKAVHLEDGTVLKADLVVVAMGVDPAVECLRDTGLVEDGAVPVTGHLETQAAGVFASGDIARLPDHRDGTPRRVEHWVEAERLGQHAARCMLGCDEPYREMPFFWTRQLGTSVRYIGWTEEWDETVWRGTPEDEEFLAGFYQDGVLRAAAGVGMAVDTIAVGELLKAGAGVAPENFQDTDYDLADALRQES